MTSAKRMSCSGRLTACTAMPGARVERAGDPEADRLDVPADRRADALDGVGDHLHELDLIEAQRRAVGTVMDRQSASTAPASSLVPPRSTPITHPSATPATLPPAPPHGRRRRPPLHHLQGAPALPARARDDDGLDPRDGDRPGVRGPRPPAALRARAAGCAAAAAPGRAAAHARPRRCASSPSPRPPGCWSRAIVFLISAQIQEAKISDAAERQLSERRLHAHLARTPC